MNITKEKIDELNSIVRIELTNEDYQKRVDDILKDYRRKANIPGFRKGHVPMSLVKKQYGRSVLIDEVNKLLQDALNNFLVEEKIDVLGNPLPKAQDDFSWDRDKFTFEFELGHAPEFEVDLKPEKPIIAYKIIADDKMIDEQVANLREQYGKVIAKEEITKDSNITGTFKNEEKGIDKKASFKLDKVAKKNQKLFIGKKVGDVIELKSKGLFEDEHTLMHVLGVSHDEVHGLDIDLKFTVEEITETELAPVDQALFSKVFGEGQIKDEKEFRLRLKEEAEKQFKQQADQHFLNAVTDSLIENTKFDLPKEFLQRWLAVAGEKQLTPEQAADEYERSEKGLRYQLIENKLSEKYDLKVTYDEIRDYAKGFIKMQLAQFGNSNPEEAELDEITNRVLANQEEAKRLSDQLMSEKLLKFFKENVNLETKEVTYDEFIKEVYK